MSGPDSRNDLTKPTWLSVARKTVLAVAVAYQPCPLLGAELDAEIERGRELQSGVAAEDTIQLPARDIRNLDKAETKHAQDVQRGRELRDQARENDDDRNRSTTEVP